MKYIYEFNFAGDIRINADSEAEAMTYFNNWLRFATGDIYLYGVNCTDCEEIEREEY